MSVKLSQIPLGSTVTDTTYFVAAVFNGVAWENRGKRFTLQQLMARARQRITALTANISTTAYANDTLQDAFFEADILTVVYATQTYQIDTDFTQDTGAGTITWINENSFEDGVKIIASI